MPVPGADGGAEDRQAAADRDALVKLHEEAAAFFREQLDSPAGARARRELETRGLSAETIRTFDYGYAPAGGRETLHGAVRRLESAARPPAQERAGHAARRRPDCGFLPKSADDSDCPGHGEPGGVRRPGARGRPGPEIPQLAGNPDLHQGPDALRAGRDERGRSEAQLLCAGRGVLRPGAGLAGRHSAGRGIVRHGTDECPGPHPETVHVESRPQF